MPEPLQLKALIEDEVKDNFLKIKKKNGFKTNAETIRYLINREHDRMMEQQRQKGFEL